MNILIFFKKFISVHAKTDASIGLKTETDTRSIANSITLEIASHIGRKPTVYFFPKIRIKAKVRKSIIIIACSNIVFVLTRDIKSIQKSCLNIAYRNSKYRRAFKIKRIGEAIQTIGTLLGEHRPILTVINNAYKKHKAPV